VNLHDAVVHANKKLTALAIGAEESIVRHRPGDESRPHRCVRADDVDRLRTGRRQCNGEWKLARTDANVAVSRTHECAANIGTDERSVYGEYEITRASMDAASRRRAAADRPISLIQPPYLFMWLPHIILKEVALQHVFLLQLLPTPCRSHRYWWPHRPKTACSPGALPAKY